MRRVIRNGETARHGSCRAGATVVHGRADARPIGDSSWVAQGVPRLPLAALSRRSFRATGAAEACVRVRCTEFHPAVMPGFRRSSRILFFGKLESAGTVSRTAPNVSRTSSEPSADPIERSLNTLTQAGVSRDDRAAERAQACEPGQALFGTSTRENRALAQSLIFKEKDVRWASAH